MKKRGIVLLTALLLVLSIAYAANYGSGTYGVGSYGIGETPAVEEVVTGAGSGSGRGAGGIMLVPVEEEEFVCSIDSDCETDQYCFDNDCYDAECHDDSECTKPEVCWHLRCVKLFDIEIVSFESPIKLGEFFEFTYFLKGMADVNDDVEIHFFIEKDGKPISTGSDTIFIGSFEEKTKTTRLFLPNNIVSGNYDFKVLIRYGTYEAKSHRSIQIEVSDGMARIIAAPGFSKLVKVYAISALIGLAAFILGLIFYIERRKIKKGIIEEGRWIKKHKTSVLVFFLFIVLGILAYYLKWLEPIAGLILWFKTHILKIFFALIVLIIIVLARKKRWFRSLIAWRKAKKIAPKAKKGLSISKKKSLKLAEGFAANLRKVFQTVLMAIKNAFEKVLAVPLMIGKKLKASKRAVKRRITTGTKGKEVVTKKQQKEINKFFAKSYQTAKLKVKKERKKKLFIFRWITSVLRKVSKSFMSLILNIELRIKRLRVRKNVSKLLPKKRISIQRVIPKTPEIRKEIKKRRFIFQLIVSILNKVSSSFMNLLLNIKLRVKRLIGKVKKRKRLNIRKKVNKLLPKKKISVQKIVPKVPKIRKEIEKNRFSFQPIVSVLNKISSFFLDLLFTIKHKVKRLIGKVNKLKRLSIRKKINKLLPKKKISVQKIVPKNLKVKKNKLVLQSVLNKISSSFTNLLLDIKLRVKRLRGKVKKLKRLNIRKKVNKLLPKKKISIPKIVPKNLKVKKNKLVLQSILNKISSSFTKLFLNVKQKLKLLMKWIKAKISLLKKKIK